MNPSNELQTFDGFACLNTHTALARQLKPAIIHYFFGVGVGVG